GGNTSVAGALAINIGLSEASATLADGATVTVTDSGAVELKAENFTANDATATASQEEGGNIGVGASIALNIGETDTDATIGTGTTVTGAGDLTLSAASRNAMTTEAKGGSAGSTAITPVIAISVSNNDTNARLEEHSDSGSNPVATTASGAVSVSASHEGSVSTVAEGDTESGSTGVGVSLALTIGTDSVIATTDRDLAAGGAMTFSARSVSQNEARAKAGVAGGSDAPAEPEGGETDQGGVNNQIASQRSFADQRASAAGAESGTTGDTSGASAETSGGSVQVAGAVGVTVVESTSRAFIPDDRTVSAGGTLTVKAENNTDARAAADGSTSQAGETPSGTGVGVAVALNVANVTNEATIGEAGVTAGGLTVE